MRPLPLLLACMPSLLALSCGPRGAPCDHDSHPPSDEDTGQACPDDSEPDCPEDSAPPADTADTGDTGEPPPPLFVAIYDDTGSGVPGAWDVGLDNIEAAMNDAGVLTQRVTRDELNEEPGLLQGFDALLFGGGYAFPGYTERITAAGKARIQEFIHGGGAYVGICAGAYFACDQLSYEGDTWDDESGYDIDLYPGVCGGPVDEVSSYPFWAPATVDFPGHASYNEVLAPPFQLRIFYAGGPFFEEPAEGAEVLATYADHGEHQGMPAAVTVPYGAGRLVLFGPHPELVEVDEVPHETMEPANRELYVAVVDWAARGEG